jgi:transcription elongation factor GreA
MQAKAKKRFDALRQRYYLSESGLLNIKSKLQDLYQKRAEYLGRMRSLKEQQSDNLSIEDSTYIQTMSSMQLIEAESQKLEAVIANAAPLERVSRRQHRVRLGSHVRLLGDGDKQLEYTIVDSIEADPFCGKISDESPLGKKLLGKQLHDTVVIDRSSKFGHKPLALRLISIN